MVYICVLSTDDMLTKEDMLHIPKFLYSKVSDKMVFIREWETYGKSPKFHLYLGSKVSYFVFSSLWDLRYTLRMMPKQYRFCFHS